MSDADGGDGRCDYSVPDPNSDMGYRCDCLRPLRHQGPCLGRTIGGEALLFCGRVCAGCPADGHPDDPIIIIRRFTGDVEAVLAGALQLGCLLTRHRT
jgi:hypothetical protein